MNKTRILVLYSLLFLLSLYQAYTQVVHEKVFLISILKKTQQKFSCDFSYLDKELKNIQLVPPADSLNLKETITYLRNSTNLDFSFLDEQNIAISFKNSSFEICGTLLSSDNLPIVDATISSLNTSVASDKNGVFRIAVNNAETLITVDFLGYKTIQLKAKEFGAVDCKKLYLTSEIQLLNTIVIKNYLTKGINTNADGSFTIDYRDFGILPGLVEPDLLQTVQALPGILSVNETVSNINVRGGTNDQNLILWDGIKMYQSSHFFGLISAFNPYLTENVLLFKNGSNAKYGDGVSSVISMHTDNNINAKFKGSAGINMISTDGYLDTPIGKKSSLQFAIRSSINDILEETPTYNQYFDKVFQDSEVIGGSDQKFSFYDASIRWLYQLTPKDLIKVNGIVMKNNLIFQETSLVDFTPISRESSAKQNNLAGGILYKRDWSDIFQSELMVYGTNYEIEAINSDILNNQRLLQENEVIESGIKLHTLTKLNNNFNLTTGYQFTETGISDLRDLNNPTFQDLVKEVVRTNSLYSSIEYKSTDKMTYANFGVRFNHFNKFDKLLVEPRISFNQGFWDHFRIELLGELKSQITSQIISFQNDFLGIENRKWVLSNENEIPIIKSGQLSIGLNYAKNNWLISTEGYYKKVNGIISRGQGFQNQFEFENDHGSYKVRGIDFLLSKRFTNFGAWLSYSYAKNDYSFNRLNASDFPNNIDIRHNMNLALTYNFSDFKFSTGFNWHSGKPTTTPISDQLNDDGAVSFGFPNGDTLEDYLRVDFSGTYTFALSKGLQGFVGISLWNLLSKDNLVNNYYRIHSDNAIEEIQELGLGFTPNAIFRINF